MNYEECIAQLSPRCLKRPVLPSFVAYTVLLKCIYICCFVVFRLQIALFCNFMTTFIFFSSPLLN